MSIKMGDLNPAFIQPREHRPTTNSPIFEPEEIPVIDISSTCVEQVIKEIKEGCEKWGFFQVTNHGVCLDKREKVEKLAREFFAFPLEEKKKLKRREDNPMGYYDSEHTKNVRDWKEVFDYNVNEPTLVPASHEIRDGDMKELYNQWPAYPLDFKIACEEYAQEMVSLSFKLLELIGLSLGLPSNRLSESFKDHSSFVRINYYPPCPFPQLALGVGPHKDPSALTALAQDDVGGLQVKRKSDGQWIFVKPIKHAFIINVGDVIQVWSNEKYESVEHRVKANPGKGRLSIPFFLNPSHYVMVKPLDELIDKDNPPKYKEYNYGKFLTARRFGDFKKLNVENIQIHHFRIAQ